MGHLQPATSMQVENSTFDSIMNRKIEQKLSKAMDISSYWVRGRVKQKHFDLFNKPGGINLGDYYTIRHLTANQKGMIPINLQCLNIGQASARVC